MKRQLTYILFLGVAIMVFSCSSPKYIYDSSSLKRQEELHNSRSANVLGGILMGTISVVSSAISETEVEWQPTEQQFKKLNLTNPTNDTLYVNMLTDIYWDKEDYCDFMDIRIPPQKKCKILVPVKANYNLYFSNTSDESDDEMIEVNTDILKSISLNPGLTVFNDSINLK
jgi:hypothetical protein